MWSQSVKNPFWRKVKSLQLWKNKNFESLQLFLALEVLVKTDEEHKLNITQTTNIFLICFKTVQWNSKKNHKRIKKSTTKFRKILWKDIKQEKK